jgi:hypothetical protein
MKKHHWLLVVLSALALILVSCNIQVNEVVAPKLHLPSGGLSTSDGKLKLTGTGLAGYEVQVLVDGQVAGVTQIGEDRTWSLEITLAEPGVHVLTLQTISNGVVVGQAASVTATMTGEAKAAEVTASVVEEQAPTLKLPSGGELEAGVLALTGTAKLGSQVQVLVDGQVAGVTQVGADGTWSLEISVTEPGEHKLAVQTLGAGGEVVAEAEPVTISLAQVLETAAAEAPAAAEVVAPELVFPIDGADILTGELTLIGSGSPGAEVEILDGSVVLGTAEVGADGEWRHTFEPTAGDYQLAVRSGGDTSTPDKFVGVRVSDDKGSIDCWSNPGIDRGKIFVVGTCDTMEDISKLKGIDLEELIAANPQVKDPDMVYPGEFVTIP